MVSENLDWVWCTIEVLVEILEHLNYCKEFMVIDVVIPLGR